MVELKADKKEFTVSDATKIIEKLEGIATFKIRGRQIVFIIDKAKLRGKDKNFPDPTTEQEEYYKNFREG